MKHKIHIVSIAIALLAVGCSAEDVSEAERDAHQIVEGTAEGALAVQRETREALDATGRELEELGARVRQTAAESREEAGARLAELRRDYEELETRFLQTVENEGAEARREVSESVRDALAELRAEIQELEAELGGTG